jgi:signal transduction histidine kinase
MSDQTSIKKRARLPRREWLFEAAVVAPTILALAWSASRSIPDLPDKDVGYLIIWIVLIASVELVPVPLWRGTIISMGFPLLMAVAFLYPPGVAGAAAFLAASDPREFRREVGALQALFNRSSIALAVWAASGVFHALVREIHGTSVVVLVGAALVAAVIDYLVNFGVISIVASIHYRTSPIRVIRELRIGRLSEFVISYLGLAVFGLMLAVFFSDARHPWWIVPIFVLPLLLARQMFFRSKALEEAHKELQDREVVLRALSNRMAEERQDERLQIAEFLHDDLAQLLFRLSIQVDVARRHLSAGKIDQTEELLLEIKETKNRTSDRVRALIRDLHRSPLGRAGLKEAIQSFLVDLSRDDVQLHADIDEVDVPAPIALLLYKTAHEGTVNALKHANASNIWVSVKQEGDEVELVLRDDGVGFDVEAPGPEGHYGMTMMRERATVGGGTFSVQSVLGQGTTITTRFPTSWLQEEESQDQAEANAPPSLPQADASPGAVATPPTSPTESIPA